MKKNVLSQLSGLDITPDTLFKAVSLASTLPACTNPAFVINDMDAVGCYKPRKLYVSFPIGGYNIKLYRYVAKEGEPFPSFYYVKIEAK